MFRDEVKLKMYFVGKFHNTSTQIIGPIWPGLKNSYADMIDPDCQHGLLGSEQIEERPFEDCVEATIKRSGWTLFTCRYWLQIQINATAIIQGQKSCKTITVK